MNIYQRIKSENVTFGKAFDTALIDKCFSLSAYKTNQRQFKQKANALIPKIVSLMSAGEKKEEDLEKQAYDFNRPKIISLLNRNFAKYKNPVGMPQTIIKFNALQEWFKESPFILLSMQKEPLSGL